MSKSTIPQNFRMGNEQFTLVYFPDSKNVNQIEPNFSLMQSVAMDCSEVVVPTPNGNVKKYMAWIRAITPAQGTDIPQKNFLLFSLYDVNINPQGIMPNSMVCYAVQDLNQTSGNIQQNFINCLFNIATPQNQKVSQEWASEIFEVSEQEEELSDDTSTTEKA